MARAFEQKQKDFHYEILPQELKKDVIRFFQEQREERKIQASKGCDILTCIFGNCLKSKEGLEKFFKGRKDLVKILVGIFSFNDIEANKIDELPIEARCYLIASYLNIRLFVLTREGVFRWSYYPPLIERPSSKKNVSDPQVVTVFNSENTFYPITSDADVYAPRVTGCIDDMENMLKDEDPDSIKVSEIVNKLKGRKVLKMVQDSNITEDFFQELRGLLSKRKITIKGIIRYRNDFKNLWNDNTGDFRKACIQVLLKHSSFESLEEHIPQFDSIVDKTPFLQKRKNLADLRTCFEKVILTRKRTLETMEKLTGRRSLVNKAVIGTSATGIIGGVMTIIGLVLVPLSFGASLGLSIAGAAVGLSSGGVQAGFRVHEAAEQNSDTKVLSEELKNLHEELAALLEQFRDYFQNSDPCTTGPTTPGISLRGFMAFGNVFRSLHTIAGIVLPAVKVSANAATTAAAVLGPISMALDIAFLSEAVYNMTTKENRSGAIDILECSTAFQTILLNVYLGC